VLRANAAAADKSAAIDRDYLSPASAGLRRYADEYKVTGATIAAAVSREPRAYADLEATAAALLQQEAAVRSACRRLKELFPNAMFPPIWLVVGHHGAGGMIEREGVIIAAERYSASPEDVVPIVMHELAHFQSVIVLGPETYLRAVGPGGTLLGRALREGSAELLAELTAGRHINPAAERYGAPRERALWALFRKDMDQPETKDWMFVRPSNPDWPPDLGYWIGYRIARSYVDQAPDKAKAIQDILALVDFKSFLQASGYTERISR
jgi:hypothetical protein